MGTIESSKEKTSESLLNNSLVKYDAHENNSVNKNVNERALNHRIERLIIEEVEEKESMKVKAKEVEFEYPVDSNATETSKKVDSRHSADFKRNKQQKITR